MNDMQDFTERCYYGAKENGFFAARDESPDVAYIAAIHDELSEAFEEWNKHDNWISYNIDMSYFMAKPEDMEKNIKNAITGVYMELTDAVIRTFSYCGYKGFVLKDISLETDRPFTKDDFCDFLLRSHAELSQVYDLLVQDVCDDYQEAMVVRAICNTFSRFIERINDFISQSSNGNTELADLIDWKLKINSRRGIKHGGNKV